MMPTEFTLAEMEQAARAAIDVYAARFELGEHETRVTFFRHKEDEPLDVPLSRFKGAKHLSWFMREVGVKWSMLAVIADVAVGAPTPGGKFLKTEQSHSLIVWLANSGYDKLFTRSIVDGRVLPEVKEYDPGEFFVMDPDRLVDSAFTGGFVGEA